MEKKIPKIPKIRENPKNGRAPRASRAAHTLFEGIFRDFDFCPESPCSARARPVLGPCSARARPVLTTLPLRGTVGEPC